MYRWRKLTPEQRQETLEQRKLQHRPKHSPPHHPDGKGLYLITSTCYKHQSWIGTTDRRMDEFSSELLDVLKSQTMRVDVWAILPNHYYVVILTDSCPELLRRLGELHGRSSFRWNGEDDARGRKVWFNTLERRISTDAHHISAIHYVHHNPVKHGYVRKWDEWKWSSVSEYLERIGRAKAARRWKDYPLLNFGIGWDD